MPRSLDIRDLLKRVRRIHLQSRMAVAEFMAGQFRSTFKGTGIEFDEVRDYQSGDAADRIDWNVTARTGSLHIKSYVEERELCVYFLVDASASNAFGSGEVFKSEAVAEFCALVGFSAVQSNDRVGLVLFTDRVERHVWPRKGTRHGLRILRDVLFFRPAGRGTSIRAALDYLVQVRRRRAIVFLLSDFLDRGYEPSLELAARRHDLIAVGVSDPRERILAGGGLVRLEDLETGQEGLVDLGSKALGEQYARAAEQRACDLRKKMASLGVDLLEIEAGAPQAARIRAFFRKRMMRRAPR